MDNTNKNGNAEGGGGETQVENEDEEKLNLNRIHQILIQTKIEPAKSNKIVELFRRVFSTNANQEKLAGVDCEQGGYHEIIPRLFLGDYRLAMDTTRLKKLGFTHILNAAEGRKFGQINTSATYYEEVEIKYQGFSIIDHPTYKIEVHFDEAIQFLKEALNNKKNRVYVHCQQGISRSATLIIAYLLQTYEHISLLDAFQLVATRRRIWPNEGFCRHLLQLEKEKKQKKDAANMLPPSQIQTIQNEIERCIVNDDTLDTQNLAKES
ncbi:unnamed protein product [Rotaria magnacalcarata]|uniref:protein-serine/threonine phosphatase n=4 Tax=Rotaria magnacalcarata TaxID=392030 RepID=A0A816SYL6_9BILA|nr:unnamed protein product [Rotaria magnacalcarata]CAF1596992.1 unnamed protein product [Rotaria magnacalcarata]CAF2092779.1 unnamed protein product [Rotaria magnacalcarata]CAF2131694.1 unnamed protein product [Rotaria magnacalcarata]CAF4057100.1 unnamed protein product [Rotaria magnacalcarata]